MTSYDYEKMQLIPIWDLRLVNKQTGWQESLTEMYKQNLLDFYLFKKDSSELRKQIFEVDSSELRKQIIDIDNNYVGEGPFLSKCILVFWQKFILHIYRVQMRINFVRAGKNKNNIPELEILEFVDAFEERLTFSIESAFIHCEIHFLWLDSYLNVEGDSISSREKIVWEVYSSYLDAAKDFTRAQEIPVDKYFVIYRIEEQLRAKLTVVLTKN